MIKALKFVQGAVATKDFVPALTHFHIEDDKVFGYNGHIAICSPIELDIKASPQARPFIKAIETCGETVSLHLNDNGKLAIKSGGFRVAIDCTPDSFPDVKPEGKVVKLPCPILPAIKKLASFISDDASRPWSQGLLFRGQSVFATNNIVYVEYYLATNFPIEMNVPKTAIQELIRINEEPIHLQVDAASLTFHFEGDRWLRTSLYNIDWPDISEVLNAPSKPQSIDKEFFEAVEKLKPFVGELFTVFLGDGVISTHEDITIGAVQDFEFTEFIHATSLVCMNINYLLQLQGVADYIDFSTFPLPCYFTGENLRGVIVGIRHEA